MSADTTDLDHDELPLFGLLVWPVLPKAEVDLKGRRLRSFTSVEQDQSCGQNNVSARDSHLSERNPALWFVTFQEVVQAEHLDALLPFHGVRWTLFRNARSGPEHLTLTEADSVDVLLPELQDQATVHHIQHALREHPLLLVLDLGYPRDSYLLQGHRSKQVHLLWGRLQVSIVQPAALKVTDGLRAHQPAPVLELQVQIRHYGNKET